MNNIVKVLIGAGVVGAVAATTYVVTKNSKKSAVIVKEIDEDGNITEIDGTSAEDPGILESIKKAATKRVVKILAWVALHQQQIESIGTIIGLGAGIFNITNAIRDFRAGNQMREQINELVEFKNKFLLDWYDYKDATNHNNQWFEQKLNDIHLDMSLLHELHEALLISPKKITKKTA